MSRSSPASAAATCRCAPLRFQRVAATASSLLVICLTCVYKFNVESINGVQTAITASRFVVDQRHYSETSKQQQQTNTSTASSSYFYTKVWPSLRTRLCPNMMPNTAYADVLFSLAREEMGIRQWNKSDVQSIPNYYLASPFPHGFSLVHKNQTLIYMSIYKAASETIGYWGAERLKPLSGSNANTTRYNGREMQLRQLVNESHQFRSTAPCIVTAVRDPISHFLSGYNEVETRILEREGTKIDRVRTAPPGLFHRFRYGTPQRFEQFVADLLTIPTRMGWKELDWIEPLHFFSMVGVLAALDRAGAKLTAYLPTLDNLNREWPAFVNKSCPLLSLPPSVTERPFEGVPSGRRHESSLDLHGIYKAAKLVWAQEGPTARALCALHAMDYACWTDLPDGIPLLCQDVYSTKLFVDGILLGV